jgi:hypothetical protein
MKRVGLSRRSLIIAALCLAIPAGIFVAARDRGPRYQGKSARYWIGQLVRNEPEAHRALLELGPAAVPALIEAVSKREGGVIESLRPKLPGFVRRYLPNPIEIRVRRERAVRVLSDLGTNAASAVPALLGVAGRADGFYIGYSPHDALMRIGEAGMPQLIEVLQGRNPKARAKAAKYLGLLGDKGGAAAPALGKALDDPNPAVRKEAVIALGQIGSTARAALPQLKAALRRDDDYFRLQVVQALWEIGGEAELTVPILIRVLGDPMNPNRARAAMILAEMGASARAAVPILTNVLREEFSYTRVKAEEALSVINSQSMMSTSANP